ncbi:MAG: hypothetical protein JKY37_31170 [Nannocystaceae bacterium]|nr:hypothetical protein [Nannocystaceae bacterium]
MDAHWQKRRTMMCAGTAAWGRIRVGVFAVASVGAACSDTGGSGDQDPEIVATETDTGADGGVDTGAATSSTMAGTLGGSSGTAASLDTSADGSSSGSATSNNTGNNTGDSTGEPGCIDYQPWLYNGFEGYSVDQGLSGEFFDAAGRTQATDDVVHAGTRAARMEIMPEDAGGFGQWGGIVPLPDLAAGRSVWVRLWVYWPAEFEFSAAPWMKFMRLHNATASGENAGYNDLYVDQADEEVSVLRIIKEIHNIWEVYDGHPIARDQWERYEVQLVIDDVSVDDGGDARFRVWRDETLIFDRTDVPTLTTPDGVINGLYLFTYWNNEMPPHNVAYIDDLAISFDDAPPPMLDDDGNPFLGDWLPCE